jgi:NADH-quinone oxidoreductase subunit B
MAIGDGPGKGSAGKGSAGKGTSAGKGLIAAKPGDLTTPIVVPNTMWQSSNPLAYQGATTDQLAEYAAFAQTDAGRHDDGRWSQLQVVPTTADNIIDLIRTNSLWPLLSGLACCAFEMMSAATSKNDMDRWGMFPFRASPRQSDVLIVAGTLTTKMAGPLVRLWEQMPEPKWCVAMGDCTVSGGRYKRSYSVVQGIDRVMPVHVYVPGCPPRPEGLIYGMLQLGQIVKDQRGKWNERPLGPTAPDGI